MILNTIIKIPRVLATGFCFAYFFVGGLFISLTILPIIHIGRGELRQKQKRVRFVIHRLFGQFVAMMEFFHLIKVTIHDAHRLSSGNGGLILANHPTLIDVVIMVSKIPDANCVVKGELFRDAYLKRVLLFAGFISNESGEALLNGARASLEEKLPIVIFPEGSRSVPDKPLHFQRGAANIAVRTSAPILNVFITCRPITLTKGAPWWAVPEKRANIELWVQEWKQTSDFVDDISDPPAAARRMTRSLQNYYEEGLQHV